MFNHFRPTFFVRNFLQRNNTHTLTSQNDSFDVFSLYYTHLLHFNLKKSTLFPSTIDMTSILLLMMNNIHTGRHLLRKNITHTHTHPQVYGSLNDDPLHTQTLSFIAEKKTNEQINIWMNK